MRVSHNGLFEFDLPSGWFEDYAKRGPRPDDYQRNFRNHEVAAATLFIYERGYSISEDCMSVLQSVLSTRPHILTPSELDTVKEALGNMAEPEVFKPFVIRTVAIGERNVLCIEGRWADDEEVYAIIFPHPEQEDRVIDIHFQAPKEIFPLRVSSAKLALKSIVWQKR